MIAPQIPIFSPCFKIPITNCWFSATTFICFYVHFKRYEIQGVFVSLCSSIIIPKLYNILSRLTPMMIFTPVTVIILEKTCIKSLNAVWVTLHMWEFQKIWPKNDDFWTAWLSCSACVQFFHACTTRKSALMIFKN